MRDTLFSRNVLRIKARDKQSKKSRINKERIDKVRDKI